MPRLARPAGSQLNTSRQDQNPLSGGHLGSEARAPILLHTSTDS